MEIIQILFAFEILTNKNPLFKELAGYCESYNRLELCSLHQICWIINFLFSIDIILYKVWQTKSFQNRFPFSFKCIDWSSMHFEHIAWNPFLRDNPINLRSTKAPEIVTGANLLPLTTLLTASTLAQTAQNQIENVRIYSYKLATLPTNCCLVHTSDKGRAIFRGRLDR